MQEVDQDTYRYLCPVCGFRYSQPIYDVGGNLEADFEICPSCGYEYAVTDIDKGYTFQAWRRKWIDEGMPWKNEVIKERPPERWNPREQLKNIGVIVNEDGKIVQDIEDPEWHLKWVPPKDKL